jgi:FG-GAP repeat
LAQIAVGDFNGDGYSDLAYFTPTYNSQPANPAVVVLTG